MIVFYLITAVSDWPVWDLGLMSVLSSLAFTLAGLQDGVIYNGEAQEIRKFE